MDELEKQIQSEKKYNDWLRLEAFETFERQKEKPEYAEQSWSLDYKDLQLSIDLYRPYRDYFYYASAHRKIKIKYGPPDYFNYERLEILDKVPPFAEFEDAEKFLFFFLRFLKRQELGLESEFNFVVDYQSKLKTIKNF